MASGCKFQKWPELPAELKIAVLKRLSFSSLMRFMLSSKESYNLVSQAKFKVDLIRYQYRAAGASMSDMFIGSRIIDGASINFEVEPTYGEEYEVKIRHRIDGGSVVLRWGEILNCYEEDFQSVAMQLLFRYMKLFDVEELKIEQPFEVSETARALYVHLGSTLRAKDITIDTWDISFLRLIIPFLPSHLSWLTIKVSNHNLPVISSNVFEHEVIRTARTLKVESINADLFDKQLCDLQASDLDINSSHITSRSVNRLIHQWLQGQREIEFFYVVSDQPLAWDELLMGIDPKCIKHVDDASEFYCELHTKYGKLAISIHGSADISDSSTPAIPPSSVAQMSSCCEFHVWGDLPAELKVETLRYLPLTSLMQFMMLSKESFLLVKKVKIKVENIRIAGKTIRITRAHQVPLDNSMRLRIMCKVSGSSEVCELKFAPDDMGGCFVQRSGVRDLHYDQDYESTALQTLFHFSRFLDVRTLEIVQRILTPGIAHALDKLSTSTLLAQRFRLVTCDSSIISKLLPCLPLHTSSIVLTNASPDTDFFDHEVIRTVQELHVYSESELFDEQLRRLQATSLNLYSSHITSSSINALITQWLKGERVIACMSFCIDRVLQWDDLLKGVDPAIIEDVHGEAHISRKLLHSRHGNLLVANLVKYCELKYCS
ncbi:unnamed protein product [Cylicocyclus nassatus]|uniref:F-box domain-containing protein n=1 Tax=Cylicocyclus nassatus TaxID=53992 RepID=A0AA36DWM3_CYLNA|nr:unnamed protein product [Cylicocyclus nassatus]